MKKTLLIIAVVALSGILCLKLLLRNNLDNYYDRSQNSKQILDTHNTPLSQNDVGAHTPNYENNSEAHGDYILKDGRNILELSVDEAVKHEDEPYFWEMINSMLSDKNPDIRAKAVSIIMESKDKTRIFDILPLVNDEDVKEMLDDILLLLNDEDPDIRLQAIRIAREFADDNRVIPYIKQAIYDNSPEVRTWAVTIIGSSGKREDFSNMLFLLNDPSPDVKVAMITQITFRGYKEYINDIIPLINDEDTKVRKWALHAITVFSGEVEKIDVTKFLYDESPEVREYAIRAAGKMNYDKYKDKIIQMLTDNEYRVRSTAQYAIRDHGNKDVLPKILALLNNETPDIRSSAIDIISYYGDSTHLAVVLELLNDPNSDVRASVIDAVANIGDEYSAEYIVPLLNDNSARVRTRAVYALGKLESEKYVSQIYKMLEDEDFRTRLAAVNVLLDNGDKIMIEKSKKVDENIIADYISDIDTAKLNIYSDNYNYLKLDKNKLGDVYSAKDIENGISANSLFQELEKRYNISVVVNAEDIENKILNVQITDEKDIFGNSISVDDSLLFALKETLKRNKLSFYMEQGIMYINSKDNVIEWWLNWLKSQK